MVLLEFVVNSFEECSARSLVGMISKCDVIVVEWHVLFVLSEHLQKQKPNFREGSTKIHFKVKTLDDQLNLHEAYNHLSRKWIQATSDYKPIHCRPWLLLQAVSAFPRVWDATHLNIIVEEIALGTIPWPSDFVGHFKWPESKRGFTQTGLVYPDVWANFFHDFKMVDFYLGQTCKMTFSYANIRHLLVRHEPLSTYVEIYFNLVNPPLIYSLDDYATRVVTFAYPVSINPTVLGKSTTLRLRIADPDIAQRLISRLHFRCGKIPVRHVAMLDREVDPTGLPSFIQLPDFKCTYLLTALVNRNYVLQLQNCGAWISLMNYLADLASEDSENLQKALIDILRLLDDGIIVNYRTAVDRLIQFHRRNAEEKLCIMPRRTRMVAHAVITPTRLILWPPEIMNDNRVLRNFDVDYALRVSFREDNFSKLNLKASTCSAHIFHRVVRQPMIEGITIGERQYEFLAWSNSQLRDHGVWMYAEDQGGRTATTIRQWMGDFSHIRNVAKFMARMGQCFSQTEDTVSVPLDESHIITMSDIVGGISPKTRKPYCFSDGIGQVSKDVAEQVCETLELKNLGSAFQIRYAGYKGMLVLNPRLQGVDIVFRESMLKFPCKAVNSLEIVKVSSPLGVYLNRQLITILDYFDVPPSVFLKLQEEQLRTLTDMLLDEEKAAQYLAANCGLSELDFYGLVESGIGLTSEPFFRAMLLALHRTAVGPT